MTIDDLQRLRTQLRDNYEARELLALVESEIKRRRYAGRPKTSPLDRREQNRINQAAYRKRLKSNQK